MKFHPYSEIFPLLEGSEFDALIADIKSFGLREKITLFQGKILDGRNRFLACQKARVKPQYRTFKGTDAGALALVISANIQRRHLNESQRASAAAKIATLRQGQQTGKFAGLTQADAAETFGVSERSVRSAKKVHEKGSKALNEAMDRGEVAVSRAANVVDLPKPKQLAAVKKVAPAQSDSDLSGDWAPPDDEETRLAAIEREQEASLQKWLDADDRLAAAHAEIKRLAAEVAVLKISRDGFQNRCGEQARIIKSLRNRIAKLEKSAA